MAHRITALLIVGPHDTAAAERFDLRPVPLTAELTLFHLDHYFTAYWQAATGTTERLDVPAAVPSTFPAEGVVCRMARELTGAEAPTFALVMTDYFGGVGGQWACVFHGAQRLSADDASINDALRALGVTRTGGQDEFDTVGLGRHRRSPEHLHRYVDLCEELGV
ncbi:hypothetical protein [Nannocystis pusilla]|uniref:hypothetical protein n=1 Tax=Nannocystis pusilla TaxID=889268 RepID=UPI003BF16BB8